MKRDRHHRLRTACALLALAVGSIGRAGFADELNTDDLMKGVVVRHEKSEGVTWYEPHQDYLTSYDFKAFPTMRRGDNGQKTLVLRAIRKSEKGIGIKSLEIHVDGASSIISLKHHDVDIDHHGCRVAEKMILEDQETLIRSIAAGKDVEFIVAGILSTDTYRLTETEIADFARIVKLHDAPDAPKRDPKPAGHVTNPEVIPETRVQPVFPKQARQRLVRGKVTLQAMIRKDGMVGDVDVIQSTACDCGFEAAAAYAVKQWRYKPGTQDGVPVDIYFTVDIDFGYR
jgi:TonB family protein